MSAARWQEPNLARAPFVNERPVRRLGIALWVLFAIVGGAAFWMSQTIRRETGTRVAELARLNSETVSSRERAVTLEAQLRRADLPAQNERAEFLNRRLAERTFSWNGLLETLAGVMPRGVRLIGLSPEGFARERGRKIAEVETPATTRVALRISGEAEETEALLEFVDRLFEHPAFDRPNLSRESERKDAKIQFDLTVDYLPQIASQPELLAAAGDGSREQGSGAPASGRASAASVAAIAADPGRIQGSGAAAPGGRTSSAQGDAAGSKLQAESARRPADAVGGSSPVGSERAAGGAATAPGADESSGDPAAAALAPGGRTRPGSVAPGVPPGATGGTRFPASVMPTPLRPYASAVGGGR